MAFCDSCRCACNALAGGVNNMRIKRWISNLLLILCYYGHSSLTNGFSKFQPLVVDPSGSLARLVRRNKVFNPPFVVNSDRKPFVSMACLKKNQDDGFSTACWSRRRFVAASSITTSLVGTSGFFPSYVEATTEINENVQEGVPYVVPFSSRRQYRCITLNNGLRVLLVSDKGVPRASASLSIGGAGQFADPNDLPGLAHLMEHMCLSSDAKYRFGKKSSDFEEWLGDREGASNAFTAPGMVCFYFNSPLDSFQEALVRFGSLFVQETVEDICQNDAVLKREVRRVDSELDFSSDASRAFYMLKSLMNPEHPFSRFSAGSKETLEVYPKEAGIDVGRRLLDFFHNGYVPQRAVLVVVASVNLNTLEDWVYPYSNVLSRSKKITALRAKAFPDPFLATSRSRLTQIVLLRSRSNSSSGKVLETLSLEWPLKILYSGTFEETFPQLIGAPAVGFVLSQMLSRRGPGSLYLFLLRRGWIPKGTQGLPRISFPVDLSGFQILKLEIGLTLDGFANRSAVVAAVFNSINAAQPFLLRRELICQYITVANIFGYALAPRPPDAVELAVDAQTYGIGGSKGVGVSGVWPLMPSVEDRNAVDALRRAVADTLSLMSQPAKAVVTILTSPNSVRSSSSLVDQALPPLSSKLWRDECLTGAKYFTEDMMGLAGLVEMWVAEKLDEDELGPPTLNPLVPSRLRPARPISGPTASAGGRFLYLDDSNKGPGALKEDSVWRDFLTRSTTGQTRAPAEREEASVLERSSWKLWQVAQKSIYSAHLPLPMMPPEPSCRCAFLVQLLSPRPARASVKQAAHAQLWLLSFEAAIEDLAELGAPGALAYDISFNKFGLRICFLGVSQNLPSYARRFCRRLVRHHGKLAAGSQGVFQATVDSAVDRAKRLRTVSKLRRRAIVSVLCEASQYDAAIEGSTFLKSCSSAVCVAQGDLLPNEAVGLLSDLRKILRLVTTENTVQTALPEIGELLYTPLWKPSSALSCRLPGISLVSDPCGRVQR